jgi:hypothetical protein
MMVHCIVLNFCFGLCPLSKIIVFQKLDSPLSSGEKDRFSVLLACFYLMFKAESSFKN